MGTSKVKRNSSSSRKDPLLPTTNSSERSSKCGACGRFVLLLLPVLGCACLLGSLFLLVYRLGVPITDATISRCLADYSPKLEVYMLIFTGATLIFIVTAMRNVQINVYHKRQKSESRLMWLVNLIAAISNIFAYIGFILLAMFEVDAGEQARRIHDIGAYTYFTLSSVYAILHIYLLYKQSHYPMYCKIIFTIVPLASTTCSIMFMVDTDNNIAFEWFSVALSALFVGLFTILFMVDSVDDELRDFFCCRRSRGQGSRNSPTKPRPRLT